MKSGIILCLILFLIPPALLRAGNWYGVSIGSKGDFDGIYFFDNQVGLIGGGFGSTFATSDGGKTWQNTANQGFRDYDFYDKQYGFGASIVSQSMGYTSNGGETWTKITPPNSNSLWAVDATGTNSAYFSGTGGGLWKTVDAGRSVSVVSPGTTDLITDIYFPHIDTGIIVLQSDGLLKTTNGADTWRSVYANTSSRITFTEMCHLSSQVVFVLGNDLDQGSFVLKTTDGGENWSKLLIAKDSEYLYGIDFYDENHGLVVGNLGDVFYTNDGGKSWDHQFLNLPNLSDVHMFSGTSAILIGDEGTVIRSDSITILNSMIENKAITLNIFPNPAQEHFFIESDEEVSQLIIMNTKGQVCVSIRPNTSGSIRVDISHLPKGVYLISGSTESKRLTSRLIRS